MWIKNYEKKLQKKGTVWERNGEGVNKAGRVIDRERTRLE